jgi:hypothetical protein
MIEEELWQKVAVRLRTEDDETVAELALPCLCQCSDDCARLTEMAATELERRRAERSVRAN